MKIAHIFEPTCQACEAAQDLGIALYCPDHTKKKDYEESSYCPPFTFESLNKLRKIPKTSDPF